MEQAGGKALDAQLRRILDIEPKTLHQNSTIITGSPDMMDEMKLFVEKYSA
jgi:fructose-1,6-bisphosphatase I